ncbi:hypothetical protein [Nocardiopsis tropica]|uniref:Uncharacterized protein n=1 Tax=Nocardiopsis tropica TaxID=109330 RepID=A0ABU7KR87_9ACTN|nr:hypothetical protein [Nocardiopsis umidischolae]MEE2051801.1 hypothetical protein [Nocardiopsis umidischolae]
MSVPTCPQCQTQMQPTGAIGARGYYCPKPACTGAAGPQYVLTYVSRGARGLIDAAVCGYTILVAQCPRCKLRVDFGDPGEKQYHTMPGGCRP